MSPLRGCDGESRQNKTRITALVHSFLEPRFESQSEIETYDSLSWPCGWFAQTELTGWTEVVEAHMQRSGRDETRGGRVKKEITKESPESSADGKKWFGKTSEEVGETHAHEQRLRVGLLLDHLDEVLGGELESAGGLALLGLAFIHVAGAVL